MNTEDKKEQAGQKIIKAACKIVKYFGLCMKCDRKILCNACKTAKEEIEKIG